MSRERLRYLEAMVRVLVDLPKKVTLMIIDRIIASLGSSFDLLHWKLNVFGGDFSIGNGLNAGNIL